MISYIQLKKDNVFHWLNAMCMKNVSKNNGKFVSILVRT